MATTEIYYFSGTGNSLALARDLADRLGAKLTPALSATGHSATGGADAERAAAIGFVFPLYDFKAPPSVEALAARLARESSARYFFAVCTYGVAALNALPHLDAALRGEGARLAAGWAVAMPHNGIASAAFAPEFDAARLADWPRRVDGICETVAARRPQPLERSNVLAMLRPAYLRTVPYLFRLIRHGVAGLALAADDTCDGCGVCARVCPVANVRLEAGRPAWGDACVTCLACLHWCPRGAVSLSRYDMGVRRYHHPAVRLADMLRRG